MLCVYINISISLYIYIYISTYIYIYIYIHTYVYIQLILHFSNQTIQLILVLKTGRTASRYYRLVLERLLQILPTNIAIRTVFVIYIDNR